MASKHNILVTVGVLAYNSSTTIRETLESVAAQTYSNIELLICDDGSTDGTLEICYSWIELNKNLFTRVGIVAVENNTGTPANCNRLLKNANGTWLKIIAADDILRPKCIEDFVDYVSCVQEAKMVYSNYSNFVKGSGGEIKVLGPKLDDETNKNFNTDARHQLYLYIERGFNISPAAFIQLDFARSLGYIEKYKVFEDTPFFVRALETGTKIYHLNKDTVLYRDDGNSVTREQEKVHFYKQIFCDNVWAFRKDIVYPLIPWYKFGFWIKEYSDKLQYRLTIKLLRNKRSQINIFLYYCFKLLNPYFILEFVCRKLCGK